MAIIEEIEAIDRSELAREFVPLYAPRTLARPFSDKTGRVLPQYIDDLTSTLRFDLYEQMLLDAKVQSCVGMLSMGILGGGIHCLPASSPGGTTYKKDVEIAEFCQRNLDNLETPLRSVVLPDMLKAIMVGHRIAEQVYYPYDQSPERGKHCLRKLKVLPRKSLRFVVDDYGNVTEMELVTPTTIEGVQRRIPRHNFAVLSWKPTDSDPRGASDGRGAYLPWWYKQQMLTVMMQYASQHGIPSIILELPGNVVKKGAQPGTAVDDFAAKMLAALQQFQNSTGMVVPNGTTPHFVEPKGDGTFFEKMFRMLDDWIEMAILFQVSGAGGKDSVVLQELMGLAFEYGKTAIEHMLRIDVLSVMVEVNYGKSARVPLVSVPGIEYYDMLQISSAYSKMASVDLLHPEQLNPMFAKMDFPLLSSEALADMTRLFEAKVKGAEQAAKPKPMPGTLPGDNPTDTGKQKNL